MSRLAGRTILITRAAEDAGAWAAAFERLGARSVVLPCLETAFLDDGDTRAQLDEALRDAEWIAFTSRRGVHAVAGLLSTAVPTSVRLAAVGERTAEEARTRLGRVDLVAAGSGTALGEALVATLVTPTKIALPVAREARRELERILRAAGHDVRRVHVYETRPVPDRNGRERLDALGIDTIVLASPSAVEGLLHQVVVPPAAQIVTIGPTTSNAARAAGLSVSAEAAQPSFDAIVDAIP